MGKRQVGELQLSELIVTIMLSDFAATPIYETDIPFSYAVIPILLLLSVEVILSFIILHVPKLKILLGGKPSFIIRKGTLDQKELKRQRMCMSELIGSLREQGISDIGDVEYAILEENGKLSVFEKASKKPPSAEDLNMDIKEPGISHALILDKIIIDRKKRTILGVHLIGAYSGEIIWGAAEMIEMQLRVADARQIIFPHPTVSEIIRETLWEFND